IAWFERSAFKAIEKDQKPKDIMLRVSEDLLQSYEKVALLDKYDIYQILMEYWDDVLQDDVSVITQDGWEGAKLIRNLTAEKDNKLKEVPDLVIGKIKYKAEVIPPHLIVAKYFAIEQATLDAKQAELDIATQELESFIEEHTADEGLLLEAL